MQRDDEAPDLISRRTFLEQTGLLAAGLAVSKASQAHANLADASPLDPGTLTPYVDALPIPETVQPLGRRANPDAPHEQLPFYRLQMQEVSYRVHRDLPPTRGWGLNSSSPGPLFDVRSGQAILVEWANNLPARHFLPIDYTLMGAEHDKPEVRAVIHLHGGRTPPASDGYPEDWYVPGKSKIYHYPNRQDAAMLFYHDHTMGINRLNIYAGLQGLYLIRDAQEDALNLPRGKYEIPILLYDRFLGVDGQLQYPVSGNPKSPWVPEVFGNCILANGKLAPYLDVEPRAYRLRLMNGSNERFYRLSIGSPHTKTTPEKSLALYQIGSDQGLLASPVTEKRVLLAPAERADLIIDFSAHAGEALLLKSDSFNIMQFRVAPGAQKSSAAESDAPPATLRPVTRIAETAAVKTRRLTLNENMDGVQQSMGMLLNNTPWHAPITEKPVLNTTEIWELVNLTEDSHPIHLHLVRFQLLDRRTFDVFHYLEKTELRFTGAARAAEPAEAGWKDTVRCDPGEVTRIIVPFEGYAGRYVWHCHLLEHEDNEMMRPFEVLSS